MYLNTTFREALPAARPFWLGIIARMLMDWVGGPRAPEQPRWYDSDGAHRGL